MLNINAEQVEFETLPKENPLNAFLSKIDTTGCRVFLTYFRPTTRSYRVYVASHFRYDEAIFMLRCRRLFLGELFIHLSLLFLFYWRFIAANGIHDLFPFIPQHLFSPIDYLAPYVILIFLYVFSWPFLRGKFYTHILNGFPTRDVAFHKPAPWILSDVLVPGTGRKGDPVYSRPVDDTKKSMMMERADLKIDHPLLHPWSEPDVGLTRAAYAAARNEHIPIDVWDWSYWEKIEGTEQWKVWQIWRNQERQRRNGFA